jgi:hypothetical protein
MKLKIVEKIEEPTEWVSSLVIVEKKNGKIRLCLDPKDLNKEERHLSHANTTERKSPVRWLEHVILENWMLHQDSGRFL